MVPVIPAGPTPYRESPGRFFQARWISHPLMALGHHQPRIYRIVRPTLRDAGDGSTAMISWIVDGQILDGDYLVNGAQYLVVSAESDSGGSRLGQGADRMSVTITAWGSIVAGTILYLGVLDVDAGTTRVYELEEGFAWSRLGSIATTYTSIGNAIDALDGVTRDTPLTYSADTGYKITLAQFWEPGMATPVPGIEAALTTPDGGAEFETARFAPGIGEADIQRRAPVSGKARGRRIQIAIQNTPGQRIFGLRSFEIDTRRTEGRR